MYLGMYTYVSLSLALMDNTALSLVRTEYRWHWQKFVFGSGAPMPLFLNPNSCAKKGPFPILTRIQSQLVCFKKPFAALDFWPMNTFDNTRVTHPKTPSLVYFIFIFFIFLGGEAGESYNLRSLLELAKYAQ